MKQSIAVLFCCLLICCCPPARAQQGQTLRDLIQAAEAGLADRAPAENLAQWLRVYDAIPDSTHPEFAKTCLTIADIYHQGQLYSRALPFYRRAFDARAGKDMADAQALAASHGLAQAYANMARPDSAILFLKPILRWQEQTGNVDGQINTLQEMAQCYLSNDRYAPALNFYVNTDDLLTQHGRPDSQRVAVLNNLGFLNNHLEQYESSISYFGQSLELVGEDQHAEKAILNTNIGIAYYNLGLLVESIEYLKEAEKIRTKHTPNRLDETLQLLATVYLKKDDLFNAQIHADRAESLARARSNHALMADTYHTKAKIYTELYEYDSALEYFQKHLELRDSLALEERFRQQQLAQQEIDLERTESQIKLLLINEDVQELTIAQLKVEGENQRLALANKEAQLANEQKEKELLLQSNALKENELKIQVSEAERARQELEISQQKENVALQQLDIQQKEAQLRVEQDEKKLLLQEKEIGDLALQQQEDRVTFFYGLGILLVIIILIIAWVLWRTRRHNKALGVERAKSDGLLLNILPATVATELRDTGKATPRKYDNVTILFTDFKDFTVMVSSMSPTKLMEELNDIYSRFDDIMDECDVEKIETIGDAYMAACGLPEEDEDQAEKCANAALKMVAYLQERNASSSIQWNMRVGIHTGPLVAGVVGKKKFAYDVFGDTVNTASRVESNGVVGKVNISESTYRRLEHLPQFQFESRGEIQAKGKGALAMWFLS